MLGINTQTFTVDCNSTVLAVLLCAAAHQHRVPFLGIQPSNVPSIGSLEHILLSEHYGNTPRIQKKWMYVMVPESANILWFVL